MNSYIIKRIILFLPTLFLVSVVVFVLSRAISDDPVFNILSVQGLEESSPNYQKEYERQYTEMHLDKSWFYFSIAPSYATNRWANIADRHERSFAYQLQSLQYSDKYISSLLDAIKNENASSRTYLYQSSNINQLSNRIVHSGNVALKNAEGIQGILLNAESNISNWHYPTLRWNGFNNQYHLWMGNILNGNFGISYLDARPVKSKVWEAMKWTLVLVFFNIFFAFLIAFPLGIYNGMMAGGRFDKWSNTILFGLFAIPKFWLATLMIVFFTTAEYGGWTNIFPNVGIWYTDPSLSFSSMIIGSLDKFILPILVLVIPDIAYLSRMIRTSIIEERSKEYAKTALVKGLSKMQVVKKHILPNALIPSITLMAGSFPTAIASSLVIEVIFNIPGVGRLMYDSIIHNDWATVYPIIFIISILTVISFLLADMLMSWLNPKIKLG